MVEFNNLTGRSINCRRLRKAALKVLEGEGAEGDLSVVFVGGERMRRLNKHYRGKNRPTDVLSFSATIGLGEIIICPLEVKQNAQQFSSSFEKELCRCLIHGLLHILGCEHENGGRQAEKMEQKQEYYLSQIF